MSCKKLKVERKCKKWNILALFLSLSLSHRRTHTPPINTNCFPLDCASFYGCVFARIDTFVSVPWGNDDKYAKVNGFISHWACSLWQQQIIIHLVGLLAYTSIHASRCRGNVSYLTKTLVLLCLSGTKEIHKLLLGLGFLKKSWSWFHRARSY